MSALARLTFAVLVCATFGAFFVAQELKSTPPLVQEVGVTPRFSPNRDGRKDRALISFTLKRTDEITATVIDREGDDVRELASVRELEARAPLRLRWDGRSDAGRPVEDGTYRVRVNLRREGRAITLPRNIIKDTRAPDIRVTSIGPDTDTVPRPERLPRADGRPVEVNFAAPGSHKEALVYRTDVTPVEGVRKDELADDATQWRWDGTVQGRRVASGTYLVAVRARDEAGNIGASATPLPPRPRFGEGFPGRGGITVRYLTAQAPTGPVGAREQAVVAVESVDQRFTWTLRRVGSSEVRSRGRGSRSRQVRFRAPSGESGLFVFEVRTRRHRGAAPLVVQAAASRPVLVVLPATTWQGRNRADDDGDGRPDTLTAGLPVRLGRPYAGSGLPAQIIRNEAPLLAHLDRHRHRYDLTTDIALARGDGPGLAGHRGVLLAGDARWLPPGLARSLRRWVQGGGRLVSVGSDSLRRGVTFTPRGRAIAPTPPTSRDLFGSRLGELVRGPVSLFGGVDRIGLFRGTEGRFANVPAFEPTLSIAAPAQLAATATTPDGEQDVIVATSFGKGLVMRTGMPELSSRLRRDPELTALMERMWALLATR